MRKMISDKPGTSKASHSFMMAGALFLATVSVASTMLCQAGKAVVSTAPEPIALSANSINVRQGCGIQISGRKLTIQPGTCWINDRLVQLSQARVVDLPPCATQTITGEKVSFAKDAAGKESAQLDACIADRKRKIVVPGVLVARSLVLRSGPNAGSHAYIVGKDYSVNSVTGAITKVKGGALQAVKSCYADYTISMHRVDTIAVDTSGTVRFATGTPAKWAAVPPAVPREFLPLYNVYAYSGRDITADDVLAVAGEPLPLLLTAQRDKNREALKDVREKLEHGKPIKISFWGDNVTQGAGATKDDASFPVLFVKRLQKKYPHSEITVISAGKMNTNSAIMGQTFYQDALWMNPDLVVIEFVNDMLFPAVSLPDHYIEYFKAVKIVHGDTIMIAPHLPSTSVVGEHGLNGNGSLTYTEMLRNLCKSDPNVAFCDVAARWQHLNQEGLKRESFLVDGLNVNDRGHEIYAEELIKCFD